MQTVELIRQLRNIAQIGIVNAQHDVAVLNEAADRLEELDERVAIMSEGKTGIELEGSGASWWYVCEECHGRVDDMDHFCRHCGMKFNNVK